MKVARASVKEQVFDAGHLQHVKRNLRTLLQSEIVPISEMFMKVRAKKHPWKMKVVTPHSNFNPHL